PVGFLLFWYSLNIRIRTQYRLARVRALKKLRQIILERDFSTVDLPENLSDPALLLSYSIVLYADHKFLRSGSLTEKTVSQYSLLDDRFRDKARSLIAKALTTINNSLVTNLE
ncbi:MAG TPA: hypothetical protein GX501_06845, partial [Clostridiaceae bacterium]|nr:hypothetical protein [Clostridiaceae bacterium]